MSLYDDASLIAYPSGYKEDKIYSLKPTNGTGDLTFSRASSATRVNEQGLIETASVINPTELVTNGSFATDLSGWTVAGNDATHSVTWTASGARFQSDTTSPVLEFKQSSVLTSSTQYVLTCNVSYTGVGRLRVNVGSNLTAFTEGANTRYFTASSSTMSFLRESANLDATISNVSVKEVITSNIPRIDYSNGCGSLLLEPQRTNLVTESEDFGTWDNTTYPITVSTNAIASPSGFVDATLLTPNSGSSRHAIRKTVSCSASTYTLSAFYKQNNAQYVQLSDGGDSAWHIVTADLDNGTITNEINATGTIEPYANDWYRITCTFTRTNATTIQAFIGASPTDSNSGLPTFDDTSLTTYAYGAQLEAGSYSTSLIPTSGTTVTRLADSSSTTGLSSVINSTEGVLYFEGSALSNDGTDRIMSIGNGTNDYYVWLQYKSSSNSIRYVYGFSGTNYADFSTTIADVTINNKIAVTWKLNEFKFYVNGVKIAEDLSGSVMPSGTLNELSFSRAYGVSPFYSNVQNLMVFDSALTDDELADLTGAVHQTFNSLATFYGYTIL